VPSRRRREEPQPARRGICFVLEPLDDRVLLTSYSAANVTALIADLSAANAAGGSNTINLTAPTSSPYVLRSVNNDTNGDNGLRVIAANDNLTILGNGDTIERYRAEHVPNFRLVDVGAGASLTLGNLTLAYGSTQGTGMLADGGAILNQGALTLSGVTVQHNIAQGSSAWGVVPGCGGGIWSILTFNQLSGDFATVNGLRIGHRRSFVPVDQNGSLVLIVEPS
jgi:hypothetical protein